MENNNEEKKKQGRKNYAPRGTRTQKAMTFRLDNEAAEYLSTVDNKGRLINELIINWGKNKDTEL